MPTKADVGECHSEGLFSLTVRHGGTAPVHHAWIFSNRASHFAEVWRTSVFPCCCFLQSGNDVCH